MIVTGGHGEDAVDHLFDGQRHVAIEVERHDVRRPTARAAPTRRPLPRCSREASRLEDAARGAARVASEAVRNGLVEIGAGEGPVNVLA